MSVSKASPSTPNLHAGAAILALALSLFAAAPRVAAEEDGKNRMVFEPGSKKPDVHEDAEGNDKPAGQPQAESEAAPAAEEAAPQEAGREPAAARVQLPPNYPDNMPESISKVLDIFYGQLGKGNIDGAYSALTTNTVIESTPEAITTLKNKTREALKIFGSIKGYEVLVVKEVGDRLLGVTCISIGDRYPLRWKFFYYMPDDAWKLIDIRVDDGISDLFPDERGKQAPQNEQ